MSLDPKNLKRGDKVKLTISVSGGTPFQTTGTMLGTSFDGKCLVYLDKSFTDNGYSSFTIYDLRDLASCQMETARALDALGLSGEKRQLWRIQEDETKIDEVSVPEKIDLKTLKPGDRVKVAFHERNGSTIKIAATMLDGSYLGKPLVYLDSRYSGYGGSSFQVRGLDACYKAAAKAARKSIKDLGLDEAGYMVWSLDKQATVDEVIMPETIDIATLTIGDKIRFLVDGKEREGVLLNSGHNHSFWIAEGKDTATWYGTAGKSSSPKSGSDKWDDCYADRWMDDAKLDRANYGLSEFNPSHKIISVEPKSVPIDQNDLEVGEDVEIEITRSGKTIKRTATVVAAAKDERDHYKNDSEAGVILHEEAPDEESASFVALSHWKKEIDGLQLPTSGAFGWRLYKGGRNATKVIKKLGKRDVQKTPAPVGILIEGSRVECAVYVEGSGKRLVRGTVLGDEDQRMVLLDEEADLTYPFTDESYAKERAAKFGIEEKALHGNLANWNWNCCDYIHWLPERLTAIPEKPLDLKEAIACLDKLLNDKARVGHNTVEVRADALKMLLDYATTQQEEAGKSTDIKADLAEMRELIAKAEQEKVSAKEEPAVESKGSQVAMVFGTALGALLTGLLQSSTQTEGVRVETPSDAAYDAAIDPGEAIQELTATA